MKKACVYTFSNTLDNYGQVLQYLAIQLYLEKFGYKAYILRKAANISQVKKVPFIKKVCNFLHYRTKLLKQRILFNQKANDRVKKETSVNPEETEMNSFFKLAFDIVNAMDKSHPRYFEDFRKQYFNIEYYNNLVDNPPKSDIYVVGSDQVWGWFGKENLLNFGKRKVKRIAFAPSFGGKEPETEEQWRTLEKGLKHFSLVTVREPDGVDICRRAGVSDVYCIPDPTFLLSASDYDKYIPQSKLPQKDYILLYLLGNPTSLNVQSVFDYAIQKELDVKYIVSQGRNDEFPKVYPRVEEWLEYIKNAKFVVTNSFHGTVFSIIYEKPFLVCPLIWPFERMNKRIINLLKKYDIQERLYQGDLGMLEKSVDYEHIRKKRILEKNFVDNLFKQVI